MNEEERFFFFFFWLTVLQVLVHDWFTYYFGPLVAHDGDMAKLKLPALWPGSERKRKGMNPTIPHSPFLGTALNNLVLGLALEGHTTSQYCLSGDQAYKTWAFGYI
jgi:hypothetical protein